MSTGLRKVDDVEVMLIVLPWFAAIVGFFIGLDVHRFF